jgi:hypothetical protein
MDAAAPEILWEGSLASDSQPRKSYFVRLFADGAGTCQCPAFYFRATLKRDAQFRCKHITRARLALAGSS